MSWLLGRLIVESPCSPDSKDESIQDKDEQLHPEDAGHPKRDYLRYLNLVSHHKKNGKIIIFLFNHIYITLCRVCLYIFISLCFCVFVFMSLCLYVSLSLCLYVSLSLCLFISMSLYLCVSVCLCLYVCHDVCVSASLCLCVTMCVCVSLYLCIFVFLYLCITSLCLSVSFSLYPSHNAKHNLCFYLYFLYLCPEPYGSTKKFILSCKLCKWYTMLVQKLAKTFYIQHLTL